MPYGQQFGGWDRGLQVPKERLRAVDHYAMTSKEDYGMIENYGSRTTDGGCHTTTDYGIRCIRVLGVSVGLLVVRQEQVSLSMAADMTFTVSSLHNLALSAVDSRNPTARTKQADSATIMECTCQGSRWNAQLSLPLMLTVHESLSQYCSTAVQIAFTRRRLLLQERP